MIKKPIEYTSTLVRIDSVNKHIDEQILILKEMNLSNSEIKRVIDPFSTVVAQLQEEVDEYDRLIAGDIQTLNKLPTGKLLIGFRIYLNISQREFANRIGVCETQVSRHERNEYRGISINRIAEIVEIFKYEIKLTIEPTISAESFGPREEES